MASSSGVLDLRDGILRPCTYLLHDIVKQLQRRLCSRYATHEKGCQAQERVKATTITAISRDTIIQPLRTTFGQKKLCYTMPWDCLARVFRTLVDMGKDFICFWHITRRVWTFLHEKCLYTKLLLVNSHLHSFEFKGHQVEWYLRVQGIF